MKLKYVKLFEEFLNDIQMNTDDLNQILHGYIVAALWTDEERLNQEYRGDIELENDNSDSDETEKLVKSNTDKKSIDSLSIDDYEPNSLIKAYKDIKEFIKLAGILCTNI